MIQRSEIDVFQKLPKLREMALAARRMAGALDSEAFAAGEKHPKIGPGSYTREAGRMAEEAEALDAVVAFLEGLQAVPPPEPIANLGMPIRQVEAVVREAVVWWVTADHPLERAVRSGVVTRLQAEVAVDILTSRFSLARDRAARAVEVASRQGLDVADPEHTKFLLELAFALGPADPHSEGEG